MKLTLILSMLTIFQLRAIETYSQFTKLTLNLEDVKISDALKEIENQSEFFFLYSPKLIDVERKVNLKAENEPIKDILADIFDGNVKFAVYDRQIVLTPADKTEILSIGQQNKITGTVTDEKGLPLAGVNVVVKGTKVGVITGVDGTYSIEIGSQTATLVFSFIGYINSEVIVGNQRVINQQLALSNLQLNEVVVVGYGTTQKKEITSSITTIKTDGISKTTAYSVENMIQGRVAGLNASLSSAQPGASLNVNIRGAISPNGNNSPLYVIDGVPIVDNSSAEPNLPENVGWTAAVDRSPLSMINPSDILSVDVLKDGSATAIYGSSAANGIIMITTKKGREGKLQVNYRGTYTVQTPKPYIAVLNAKDFMEQNNRMSYEKYLYNNNIAPYGNTDPSTVTAYNPMFSASFIANNKIDNNWQDMLIHTGHINDHSISINGGSATTKIYASFDLMTQKSILDYQDYNRYTGRMNFDQKIGSRVNVSLNLSLSRVISSNASFGEQDGGEERYNMLTSALRFAPTTPIYNPDGSFARSYSVQITNPMSYGLLSDKLNTNRVMIIPKVTIDIIKGLVLNISGGADLQSSTRKSYQPVAFKSVANPYGLAGLNENSIANYTAETYLNYSKDFGKSRVNLVVGSGIYRTQTEGWGLSTTGFFTDAMGYNNIGIASKLGNNTQSSNYAERYKISQFFRANYTYHDRYTLSVVGRRDGSTIFSENHKYGFFPGVSAAWRINQEGFMSSLKFISDLKLRAGYGTAGNESVLSGNTLALYGPYGGFLIGNTATIGVVGTQLANPNLTWETDISENIGIDYGLFGNRISGSVDVYRKTAKNLLDFDPLPFNNPINQISANVGSTRSQGFELALQTINVRSGKFQWETRLTLSHDYARWIERNPSVPLPSWVDPKGGMADFYGWETDGIIKKVSDIPACMPNAYLGNIKYVDQNNDGKLDSKDIVKLFNWNPKFNFGFENTFTYDGLDLKIFLYGVINQHMSYGFYPDLFTISSIGAPMNAFTSVKDVWTHDNPNGSLPTVGLVPNIYSNSNPAGTNSHDFGITNVNYARIKTITLGYNLSKIPAIEKLTSNMRVFVTLDNVYLFTNYEGFDPEIRTPDMGFGSAPFPQALSTSFGLDVTF